MKKVMMGTEAAALAAKLARVQVVSAYPITPQTVIVENLADIIGRGELDAKLHTRGVRAHGHGELHRRFHGGGQGLYGQFLAGAGLHA